MRRQRISTVCEALVGALFSVSFSFRVMFAVSMNAGSLALFLLLLLLVLADVVPLFFV